MTAKKRNNEYDLLRIISCIAVIMIHVSATFRGAVTSAEGILITQIFNTISRFAVPCFIMLAGAFALDNDRNMDYRRYYRKIFASIAMPTIIFSILYTIYNMMRGCAFATLRHQPITANMFITPLKETLVGNPFSHLVYLYMIAVLYLLVPVIIRWKNELSESTLRKVIIATTVVISISSWTATIAIAWGVRSFFYLGYFLMGYLIKSQVKVKDNLKGSLYIGAGLLIEIAQAFYIYTRFMNGVVEKYSVVGPLNPVIVLASILIFLGFAKLEIKRDYSKLAGQTFTIYLVHYALWDVIGFVWVKLMGTAHVTIVMIAMIIIVMLLSIVVGKLYNVIWNAIDSKFNITVRLRDKLIPEAK